LLAQVMRARRKIGPHVIPGAFQRNCSGVAGLPERFKKWAEILQRFAGVIPPSQFRYVRMLDQMPMARDFGCWFTIGEHVVEIGQKAHVGMGALLDSLGALRERIDEIAFPLVQRLHYERDPVALGENSRA